jgi:glutamate synthase (ferredoxin)
MSFTLQVVSFYEFYEGLQEGWDGPALLVFSDGEKIGARLDRNGLRPARFWATNDGYIYVASEVGQELELSALLRGALAA